MNAVALRFAAACCLGSCLTAAELPTIKSGSEEWRTLYEPAFEKPTELDADSELRKSLFQLIRQRAEKIAKQPVKFQGHLRVYRNWAFFGGSSVDVNGKPVEYPELGNSDTVALWLRTLDGWKLVDFAAGHSDAFFIIWPEQYGMPAELLK
ncbi:MAG: hypothetical protein ACKVY0_08850 [Prosthecobacter sp.]|uniref:hypothetical protein n=1 Tax=Prosthecobacter sp. TaxID=1965333 RepID=UPI00390167BD